MANGTLYVSCSNIPRLIFWMAYLLHSLNSVIFSQNNEINSSAGEKSSSRIISTVIFYEESQRGWNLVTQVWCLVYLSTGFEFSSDEWNLCSVACNFSWLHQRLFIFVFLPWSTDSLFFWHSPPPLHKVMHISRIYLSAIHRVTFISMDLLYLQNKQNHTKKKKHRISLLVVIWEYTYGQHFT